MSLIEHRVAKLRDRLTWDPILRERAAVFLSAEFKPTGEDIGATVGTRTCTLERDAVILGHTEHPEKLRIPL